MWGKHRLMNALVRKNYAWFLNDADVLAMPILSNHRSLNHPYRRFLNIDTRKFNSDKSIEVLNHLSNTVITYIGTHPQFLNFLKKILFLNFHRFFPYLYLHLYND